MGIVKALGKYALIGVASVMLYEGVEYLAKPDPGYQVKIIENKPYVIDHTASPADTVAAPKLFEVYGFFKDVEKKTGALDQKYSQEKGWYESRR